MHVAQKRLPITASHIGPGLLVRLSIVNNHLSYGCCGLNPCNHILEKMLCQCCSSSWSHFDI